MMEGCNETSLYLSGYKIRCKGGVNGLLDDLIMYFISLLSFQMDYAIHVPLNIFYFKGLLNILLSFHNISNDWECIAEVPEAYMRDTLFGAIDIKIVLAIIFHLREENIGMLSCRHIRYTVSEEEKGRRIR